MKIDFYRIEDENGKGAFENGAGLKATSYLDNLDNLTPPDHDFNDIFNINADYDIKKQWYFGCLTLDHINQWFNTFESVAYLKMRGCSISKYSIDSKYIIEGSNQIIFKKGKESFIEKIELNPFDFKKTSKVSHQSTIFVAYMSDIIEQHYDSL